MSTNSDRRETGAIEGALNGNLAEQVPPASIETAADGLLSRRILILANALRRAAGLRYRRLLDLRQNEWSIIAELGARSPRTLNDVAASLGLDKAQMSRSVSDLVARGLVLRRPNPADSREVSLRFSAKGRTCYAKLFAAGTAANRDLLADFDNDARARLAADIEVLMRRAHALLQAERDQSAARKDAGG